MAEFAVKVVIPLLRYLQMLQKLARKIYIE